ncbi:nitrate- and nitrite sensing domain-containing protein [Winogradskya humida]|uniref:nitrate- and nitrite sensing domain-containing protein n=1 Tax=Winogradskya humida TaxID=113566 RepID=UPI001940843C|nr:nitrate- and nitrite sensing domain-containing protein [Actinoplanes humidus]
MALPLALTVAFAAVTAVTVLSAAADIGLAQQLVEVGLAGNRLTEQLQRERAAAALVFTQDSTAAVIESYRAQCEVTDHAAAVFARAQGDRDVTTGVAEPLSRLNQQLEALPLLREQVRSGRDASGSLVTFRYTALAQGLLRYGQALSQADVDADTADRLRAVSVLSQGIEALATLQVTVEPAIAARTLTPAEQQQVIAADAGFTDSRDAFRQLAPPAWQSLLTSQPGGKQIVAGERLHNIVVRTDPDTRLALGTSAVGWVNAMNARTQQLHAVEARFGEEVVQAVADAHRRQQRNAALIAGLVLAGLAVVLAFGWRVSRSMTGPLGDLVAEMTTIATVRLPAMETRLSEPNAQIRELDELIADASRPLPVHGDDEIGAVARLFSQVLQLSARIAARQAQFRGIVNVAFTSLSFELHGKIDKLTDALDGLERGEEDPEKLAQLFHLDHLVTGLRRPASTLQLFAGGRVGKAREDPVRVTDVVKAALGRVDGYERVQDRDVDMQILIDGDLVEELIHILVELLTNALSFSHPDQPVFVSAHASRNQLFLQVRDRGVGLKADRQIDLQDRVETFHFDTYTAVHHGFAGIGLIAARRGITVQLHSVTTDGTQVEIVVPDRWFRLEPLPRLDPPPAARRRPTTADPAATMRMPALVSTPPQPPPVLVRAADATRELQTVAPAIPAAPQDVVAHEPEPIYQAVAGRNPLFDPAASSQQVLAAVSLQWQPSPAVVAPAVTTTQSGLPVRMPRVPQQRDRERSAPAVPAQVRASPKVQAQWASFGQSSASFITAK